MLLDIFSPVNLTSLKRGKPFSSSQFGGQLSLHTNALPDLKDIDIAIIGIPEVRGFEENIGAEKAPDAIRSSLYRLFNTKKIRAADLGNLKCGATLEDTYRVLSDILAELKSQNITAIILGGTHDLAVIQAKVVGKTMVLIDETIDETILSAKYEHLSFLGYQAYLTDPALIEEAESKKYDYLRLGKLREDLTETEPYFRNANAAAFNITAVRQADAPAYHAPSTNGVNAEEACALARYAGLSNSLSSFGIYNVNPEFDNRQQTGQLAAQMIWHFTDGYYLRKNDDPAENAKEFIKYHVSLKEGSDKITFLKSNKTERWWLEAPGNQKRFIPCSYNDYLAACKEELPERWMKLFH